MIELKLYKNGELAKTCQMPFVPWNVTRYCASLVNRDGTFKDDIYNEDPMKLYEDLVIKLFSNQVDENMFEEYQVEGSEVIRVGKIIFDSVANQKN